MPWFVILIPKNSFCNTICACMVMQVKLVVVVVVVSHRKSFFVVGGGGGGSVGLWLILLNMVITQFMRNHAFWK